MLVLPLLGRCLYWYYAGVAPVLPLWALNAEWALHGDVPGVARAWCSSGYGMTGPPHDLLRCPAGGVRALSCNGSVLALHWLFLGTVSAILMLCLFTGAVLALPVSSLCFWLLLLCWASYSCITGASLAWYCWWPCFGCFLVLCWLHAYPVFSLA
jgi:hypothetical protein